jgi:deoxycytidine triphosphate deaminase
MSFGESMILADSELKKFVTRYVEFFDPANIANAHIDVRLAPTIYMENNGSIIKGLDRATYQCVSSGKHASIGIIDLAEVDRCENVDSDSVLGLDNLYVKNDMPHDGGYIMGPGEFLLGVTMEKFTIPKNMRGLFTLRSRFAKRGLEQSTSITLHGGWSGHLILELKNFYQSIGLRLRPGIKIGQIEFASCGK